MSADYERLYADVVERGMELAWMPPLLHLRGAPHGIDVAAVGERSGVLTYRSAIVVVKESRAVSLLGLKGSRFAWTDKNSASGYLFPRMHLIAAGLDPKTDFASETFYGPVISACAAVADRAADVFACHVSEAAAGDLERALQEVTRHYRPAQWRLRVLDVTDSIAPDGIVFGPGTPAALRPKITSALLRMHDSALGKSALVDLLSASRLLLPTDGVRATFKRAAAMMARMDG